VDAGAAEEAIALVSDGPDDGAALVTADGVRAAVLGALLVADNEVAEPTDAVGDDGPLQAVRPMIAAIVAAKASAGGPIPGLHGFSRVRPPGAVKTSCSKRRVRPYGRGGWGAARPASTRAIRSMRARSPRTASSRSARVRPRSTSRARSIRSVLRSASGCDMGPGCHTRRRDSQGATPSGSPIAEATVQAPGGRGEWESPGAGAMPRRVMSMTPRTN
jgi:hypothetical protein